MAIGGSDARLARRSSFAARYDERPAHLQTSRFSSFGVAAVLPPDLPTIRDYAQTVEGLGFDSVWIPDHPMVTANATWTVLAAIAAATRSSGLGQWWPAR